MMLNLKNQKLTSVNFAGQKKIEMLYIAIVVAQNWNKWYINQVSQITMRKGYNKKINYKKLRKKMRSKRYNIESYRLEKLEAYNKFKNSLFRRTI
jgi:hypothetical protein